MVRNIKNNFLGWTKYVDYSFLDCRRGNLWIMVGKNWKISLEIQGQHITTTAPIMSGAVYFSFRYLT